MASDNTFFLNNKTWIFFFLSCKPLFYLQLKNIASIILCFVCVYVLYNMQKNKSNISVNLVKTKQ